MLSHIDSNLREGRAAIRNEGQDAENLFLQLVMNNLSREIRDLRQKYCNEAKRYG